MASILKAVTKLGLAGGAIYLTVDQGIWSSTDTSQGVKALDTVKNVVLPSASDYAKKLPTVSDVGTGAAQTWNSGVKTVFSFVASGPDKACACSKKGASYIRSSVTS